MSRRRVHRGKQRRKGEFVKRSYRSDAFEWDVSSPSKEDQLSRRQDLARWSNDPWREWHVRQLAASDSWLRRRVFFGHQHRPPLRDFSSGSSRKELAGTLAAFKGRWVAVRGSDVVYAADSNIAVIMHLREVGTTADSLFRVPVDPECDRFDDL